MPGARPGGPRQKKGFFTEFRKRGELPEGANGQRGRTARSAKSQTAPNPRLRGIPDGAKSQTAKTARRNDGVEALARSPLGSFRSSGFRAVSTSRPSGVRALREFALYSPKFRDEPKKRGAATGPPLLWCHSPLRTHHSPPGYAAKLPSARPTSPSRRRFSARSRS
jgi:hypothetical protein